MKIKKSELKFLIREAYRELLKEYEEFNISKINRTQLKKFLAILDNNDISYDLNGRDEILTFDSSELNRNEQNLMKKIGLNK